MMINHEITIGIDIGFGGGISFFDTESSELLSIYSMPIKSIGITKSGRNKYSLDLEKLNFILEIPKNHKDRAIVVFEEVHAFPGQGVVSVGTLLEQKGIIEGMSQALGYNQFPISPKSWQKYFGIVPPKGLKNKVKRKEWLKNNSRDVATGKFQEFSTKFEHKTSHGLSDACLIGLFYLEIYGNPA